MDVLKFGFKYWKKRIPMAIFCQLLGFLCLTATLLLPQLTQLIFDFVIDYRADNYLTSQNNPFLFLVTGGFGSPGELELFFSIAIVFAGLLLFRIGGLYLRNNLFIRNGIKFEDDLRRETYKKLVTQSSAVLSRYSTGDLLNLMNGDIISFKELFAYIFLVVADAIFMCGAIIFLLSRVSWYLVIIPLALTPFMLHALKKYIRAARDISAEIRQRSADINMNVSENINAVRLIRAYANEQQEIEKFQSKNLAMRDSYFKHADITSGFGVKFGTIRQVAYISSLTIGSLLIFYGEMTTGALVAFTGYVLSLMDNITNINNMMFTAQQFLVCGGRIMIFMETGNIIDDPQNPLPVTGNPHFKTEGLSVVIDEQTLLKNINIDIPYGKKLGIMGGTGSGKTVLLKVLSRMLDATGGMVMLNGHDLRDYLLEDIRRQFSSVLQEVFLFSNTIDANIAFYNPDAPPELVREMADRAQALEFVEKLPQGFETVVGERGFGLSGGQKQRISIARALLKDAPVLVLDDATSALDMNTEKLLLQMIDKYYSHKTLIIAAHRATSVVGCDEIIYLRDGEIVERGSFEQLMDLKGMFYQIYKHQSAESEEQISLFDGGESTGGMSGESKADGAEGSADFLGEQKNA